MPRKKDKMVSKEDVKMIGRVIAEAWAKEASKSELMNDPVKVLKKAGLKIPSGVRIEVLEEKEDLVYLVLPLKPSGLKATDIAREGGDLCSMGTLCSMGAYCCRGTYCS